MNTLVVGATGATGRLLVAELLERGASVRVVVRSPDRIPQALLDHPGLLVTQASILELSDAEMLDQVSGCEGVASCLGHTLSWKGIFGHPRKLVADATRRLCSAVLASEPKSPVKFILMNTAVNSNRDLEESVSPPQRVLIGLFRLLLPPHLDNEMAADYLRTEIGRKHEVIEWVAVRPDTLIDENEVTDYKVHPSPTRSALFNPGKTSRINVGHFMADLLTEPQTLERWKWQMPVIYNGERTES